mmetsp:Transcript_118311/g.339508  ORF Transcript_118311/g.339508 Transcript_118311/m.339508 type:complete len:474 (+) Transcript_118311:92-1513(+)
MVAGGWTPSLPASRRLEELRANVGGVGLLRSPQPSSPPASEEGMLEAAASSSDDARRSPRRPTAFEDRPEAVHDVCEASNSDSSPVGVDALPAYASPNDWRPSLRREAFGVRRTPIREDKSWRRDLPDSDPSSGTDSPVRQIDRLLKEAAMQLPVSQASANDDVGPSSPSDSLAAARPRPQGQRDDIQQVTIRPGRLPKISPQILAPKSAKASPTSGSSGSVLPIGFFLAPRPTTPAASRAAQLQEGFKAAEGGTRMKKNLAKASIGSARQAKAEFAAWGRGFARALSEATDGQSARADGHVRRWRSLQHVREADVGKADVRGPVPSAVMLGEVGESAIDGDEADAADGAGRITTLTKSCSPPSTLMPKCGSPPAHSAEGPAVVGEAESSVWLARRGMRTPEEFDLAADDVDAAEDDYFPDVFQGVLLPDWTQPFDIAMENEKDDDSKPTISMPDLSSRIGLGAHIARPLLAA